jgi:hypothetical protein
MIKNYPKKWQSLNNNFNEKGNRNKKNKRKRERLQKSFMKLKILKNSKKI